MPDNDDRRKALNLAIAQIEKTCGKGSIMRMGSERARVRVESIGTGAINLDAACGWARGKADVLYVADAFEVMRELAKLL